MRFALLLSVFVAYTAEAQNDTVLCACQPSAFTLTLDFNLTCEDRDIVNGLAGVADTACSVFSATIPNVTNRVPVLVTNVVIAELDQDLDFVKEKNSTDSFVNGDQITYRSFVATRPDSITAATLPRGLRVSLTGANADGVELTNAYVILYTNNCSIYPVLEAGMQIGWTVLVSALLVVERKSHTYWNANKVDFFVLSTVATTDAPSHPLHPQRREVCPLAIDETIVPSDVSSAIPSSVISTVPSNIPTTAPTGSPSAATPETLPPATEAPVVAPFLAPFAAPVEAPVEPPVEAPVQAPVEAPVETPVKAPLQGPTTGASKSGKGKGMSKGGMGQGMSSDGMVKGKSKSGMKKGSPKSKGSSKTKGNSKTKGSPETKGSPKSKGKGIKKDKVDEPAPKEPKSDVVGEKKEKVDDPMPKEKLQKKSDSERRLRHATG